MRVGVEAFLVDSLEVGVGQCLRNRRVLEMLQPKEGNPPRASRGVLRMTQRTDCQETVKSASTVNLPVLPGITESAAVDFGDWLHTITNSIQDISANSSVWWQEVLQCMCSMMTM